MTKDDRELLFRIDERLISMNEKLDSHVISNKEDLNNLRGDIKEVQKEIKTINRWRYGIIGSWLVSIGSYLKG